MMMNGYNASTSEGYNNVMIDLAMGNTLNMYGDGSSSNYSEFCLNLGLIEA